LSKPQNYFALNLLFTLRYAFQGERTGGSVENSNIRSKQNCHQFGLCSESQLSTTESTYQSFIADPCQPVTICWQ